MFKIHSILCPVDFSDASHKAVQYAREFAASMGASVYLLNVVEPRPMAVDITLNYFLLKRISKKQRGQILMLFFSTCWGQG